MTAPPPSIPRPSYRHAGIGAFNCSVLNLTDIYLPGSSPGSFAMLLATRRALVHPSGSPKRARSRCHELIMKPSFLEGLCKAFERLFEPP